METQELEAALAVDAAAGVDPPPRLWIARELLKDTRARGAATGELSDFFRALGAAARERIDSKLQGAAPARRKGLEELLLALGRLEHPRPLPADPRNSDVLQRLLEICVKDDGARSGTPLSATLIPSDTLFFWNGLSAPRVGLARLFVDRAMERYPAGRAVLLVAVLAASAALLLARKAAVLGLLGRAALERALLAGDSAWGGLLPWLAWTAAAAFALVTPLGIAYSALAQPWWAGDRDDLGAAPTPLGLREAARNLRHLVTAGKQGFPFWVRGSGPGPGPPTPAAGAPDIMETVNKSKRQCALALSRAAGARAAARGGGGGPGR
eukprot:tig00001038_g6512.t1